MLSPLEATDAIYEPNTGVWFFKDADQAPGVARIDLNSGDSERRDFTTLGALEPYINTERVRLVRLSPADFAASASKLGKGALMKRKTGV